MKIRWYWSVLAGLTAGVTGLSSPPPFPAGPTQAEERTSFQTLASGQRMAHPGGGGGRLVVRCC